MIKQKIPNQNYLKHSMKAKITTTVKYNIMHYIKNIYILKQMR